MKHNNLVWSIQELIDERNSIDPRPQYQRTPVWTNERKALLIDSIMHGYDLPKFYVKNLTNSPFKVEVADGQQRMRAIWEFYDDSIKLPKNCIINGIDLSEKRYSELSQIFKTHFLQFTLSFTEIYESRIGEINELFKRLQKGVTLNPPELRHAIISEIGYYLNNFIERPNIKGMLNESKIKDLRFKHQDYLDHVITLIHYKNKKDLKADLMGQLYYDFESSKISEFKLYFQNSEIIINKMREINSFNKGLFKNKWAFVDYFWLLYKNINNINDIDSEDFSNMAKDFETERLKYNSQPEKLLSLKRVKFGLDLFNYIQAFNKEGAKKESLNTRFIALNNVFTSIFP